MDVDIRKLIVTHETVLSEAGQKATPPINRAVGIAVVENPYAGRYVADLSPMFHISRDIAAELMPKLVALLDGPPVSYGKAAIVGAAGDVEHGGALIHPMLGKPMRDAVGGGEALIPSNCKVSAAGTPIDLPLGHKDNPWSFDHFDTMTIMVADAPRPTEILLAMAIADGGRVDPRVGSAPIV